MEDSKVPPVQEGEIVNNQVVINKGKHDDGVVKYEGYIIFVSGENIGLGDTISFEMEKVLPKFGIAHLVKEE